MTQDDLCGSDPIIKIIIVKFLPPSTKYNKQIEIEVEANEPYSDLADSLAQSQWTFKLHDPIRLIDCQLKPIHPGFKVEQEGNARPVIHNGMCVGELRFRLSEVWQADVTNSNNVRISVKSDLFNGEVKYLNFPTPPLKSSEVLPMFFSIESGWQDTFHYDLSRRKLLDNDGKIEHDSEKIADLVIEGKRANPNLGRLIRQRIRELRIKIRYTLIEP